jgi:hypothetical protein
MHLQYGISECSEQNYSLPKTSPTKPRFQLDVGGPPCSRPSHRVLLTLSTSLTNTGLSILVLGYYYHF